MVDVIAFKICHLNEPDSDICPRCNGDGVGPYFHLWDKCPVCSGSGIFKSIGVSS